MQFELKEESEFKYIEEGEGKPLLLLHGLFGALSNWDAVVSKFKSRFKVIIPMLPIYEMPVKSAGIPKLVEFIEKFVRFKNLRDLYIIGNSLGGHLGLVYTLAHPNNVKNLILTGSSGLYENSMGSSFPRRSNYQFVEEKVKYTFYDPNIASKKLIDSVYNITKSIPQCLRMIAIAKSAQRHNLAKELHKIHVPTLLVWGLNDTITPPIVGHEFNALIPNSELKFIDKCCHAPMMEHPEKFNAILDQYLEKHDS